MDTRKLLAELGDETLRERVDGLVKRMRTQDGARRQRAFTDIAALIDLRRLMSEAKRADQNLRRDWHKDVDR